MTGTANANRKKTKLTCKNNALFRLCISKTNNIFIDYAKDLDIATLMYNLSE